ncbi:MAG: VWA domain-containing protein [Chloroflexota bacterium]|nr:VWA domain-containing protein [Chloroflexota bacterium]
MSLLTPLGLLVGALAVPILLLYMLRLRRREIVVSSNFLWQQILKDREANTPWQKLRRNLLLFLQLLILAFLAFALARPYIVVPGVSAGQIALLLDASASMNATDAPAGTRLDEAKARAVEIVDAMRAGDTMTVIRVAAAPVVLLPYTDDRAALRAAIQSAAPSSGSADWDAALTLAAAGARRGDGDADAFSTVIVGDGGLGDAADLPPIPGTLRYVPIGASADNLSLSALATRTGVGETPQLFAQVVNHGDTDAETIFSLRVDGELFTAERYTIPAGGALPIVSAALPADFETLEARLTPPSDAPFADNLPTDNAAFAVTPGAGATTALVMTDGNLFLEQMLRTLPGVQPFRGNPDAGLPSGGTRGYDLYIFDGWQPAAFPAEGDLLFINPTRSTAWFEVGGAVEDVRAIRVERADPRMAFVDFGTVNVLRAKMVAADWADALIEADAGADGESLPLLLAGEVDGRQIAILTFDLRDSDLPLQIAFPVLMASLLDWYAPQSLIAGLGEVGEADAVALRAGDSLALNLPTGADSVRVTLPDGVTRAIALSGAPVFAETDQLGVYRVEALDAAGLVTDEAAFAVNLFDPLESAIAPRADLTLGGTIIPTTQEESVGQREFWWILALIGLIVLLAEWWVYHRRTRVRFAS